MFKKMLSSNLLFMTTTFTFLCVPQLSIAINYHLSPYAGVDLGIQTIKFEARYGDNLFSKNLPKGNFFVGVKLNDYFGIEGGYETTFTKTKNVTLVDEHDDDYLGLGRESLVMTAGNTTKLYNKIKISGLHLGITGEYPIYFHKKQNSLLSIIGYIGMKRAKINISSNLYYHSVGPELMNFFDLNQDNKKNILKLSMGLKYAISKHFDIRLIGSWENLSRLNPKNAGDPELLQAKLKNSLSYNLGVRFKF